MMLVVGCLVYKSIGILISTAADLRNDRGLGNRCMGVPVQCLPRAYSFCNISTPSLCTAIESHENDVLEGSTLRAVLNEAFNRHIFRPLRAAIHSGISITRVYILVDRTGRILCLVPMTAAS